MATQYQNYKSDFVLRQSFEDITGAPYPLPADIDFTLRYWTQHGREYIASRQGGVYTNCAPEGDALLVFFKDHNLCEGELHNELHLPLDNPLFEGGTQNVFYPADLHILLWDKASSTDKLTSGLVADYTRGRAFAFGDFTPEQIEQLQPPPRRPRTLPPVVPPQRSRQQTMQPRQQQRQPPTPTRPHRRLPKPPQTRQQVHRPQVEQPPTLRPTPQLRDRQPKKQPTP